MPQHVSTLRIVLVGLGALAIAMGIGRFAFTPLLPLMQADGLIGVAGGGALASVHFLGYWLGAVFAGRLPGSPRSALRNSLIAIGICTLGMGMTDSLAIWLLLRWLCGVCSAFTLVLVSNFYIKHLAGAGNASMQGWVFSGVGVGIAVAGLATLAIMAGGIGSALSWQLFGVATLAAVFFVCMNVGPEITDERIAKKHPKSQRSPLSWRIVIAYGAVGVGYIIPATYLPVMARDIVQSPLVFGWSWPAFGTAAFLSTLLAARLQRRYSNRQIWVASQIVMAVGLVLPIILPHIVMIIISGICVGGTFMIITMAGMQEAHRIAPAHDVMRHIAVMTAAFASGQMIGPLVASMTFELTAGFSFSLATTSIILVATALPLTVGSIRDKSLAVEPVDKW